MNTKPDSLIFDLDGTLWDAVDSYVWIWNEAFRQLEIDREFTREEMVGYMGMQPEHIIEKCIDSQSETDIMTVYNAVFGLQERTMPLLGGKLYEGVREGLTRLSEKYKLFILSNCESYGVTQFLEFTGLQPLFTDGLSYGETRMPKALNLQLLKARHQLNNPVYVGDTDSDSKQTSQANMNFAFVNYGFGHTEHFSQQFDSFGQLTEHYMNM